MPSADFTPYNQPQGTTSDGTKYDNFLAYLQSLINALDNGNIAPAAAIAYTKLALAGHINLSSDVDTATSLAIARLAGYPSDGSKALMGDGTWGTVGGANVGSQLDYKQITTDVTGITATTEGTAATVITGNSVAYDGTRVKVEAFFPQVVATSGSPVPTFVLLRDTTVLGQFPNSLSGTATVSVPPVIFDTPSAATHAYVLKCFVNGGTLTVKAGLGGSGALAPAFLRTTKA